MLSFQRTALGAVVNVILNFLLIPDYGPVGAAVATVISQATAAFLFDAVQPVTREMFFMKIKSMNLLRLSSHLR
jgi:PST family polysaccharide transporter